MKKNCFLTILLITMTCNAFLVSAEEMLDWDSCVREAKKLNPTLLSASEKVSETKATKEITRSAYLPQVTGTASENTTNAWSGGGSGSTGTGPDTAYEYGGSIQQLLFDGFKTSYDLSAAERNIGAARYNYNVTSSNVRLGLRTAFANLLGAQELLRVAEEIEARRKQNFELVRLRYEGGREHKGSLAYSEADLAQAIYEVNQARRKIYQAQRQVSKELGRSTFVPIRARGELEVKDAEKVRPDFERLAESNPFLQKLIQQKEAAKFGVSSAKAQFFPQIYATGSESNSNINSFPAQNEWSVGASLTFPIFDGGNTIATVAKAKATFGQTVADERSGRDGVILTLADTWTRLQDAIENVGVQLKYLKATEERAKIADAEYSIGLLIYDNWIIIENNLVTAKKNYLYAQVAALIAEASWVQAKGGTLEYD